MARLRWRLRTAMLLPILAAVGFMVSDWIWFAQARPLHASRQNVSHARSLGPPSPKILAERDRLLALASTAIRADLLALAERYPHLKKANHRTFLEDLGRPDPPGALKISVSRYEDGLGGEKPGSLGPGESLNFDAYFFEHSIDEPPFTQTAWSLCFPHLGLWGRRDATAEDWWLALELRQILNRRLAPLDALEARLAALPIPPTGVPGGMPAAR